MIIAAGKIQALRMPNTMIQTTQPPSEPLILGFIISPPEHENYQISKHFKSRIVYPNVLKNAASAEAIEFV
jgi:hypothetical protein